MCVYVCVTDQLSEEFTHIEGDFERIWYNASPEEIINKTFNII